jgi:AcrR family transcriptional regulator
VAPSAVQSRLVHEALIYSSDEELLARVVPFLRDGLAAGEPAIAVLTPSKLALLREALGEDAQRVSFADATMRYRRPARAAAELREHLDAELLRGDVEFVRMVGEIPYGPSAQEHSEWRRYESVVNRALADFPAWIICIHDARVLTEQILSDARCTHPFVSTRDARDQSAVYIETDEVEQAFTRDVDGVNDPLVRLTVAEERDLDDLRRVVSGAARAAGLAPTVVDDVTVGVAELVRDAFHGDGEATVEVAREGARLRVEVSERGSTQNALDTRVGLSIAHLVSERVELDSEAGAHTVRLTLDGAADARQRILDGASELFYQDGIRATGINTIISYSGVAKATFFKYFPAKDDLVLAWLQQPASRWLDRIRTELDAKTASPANKLLGFFDLLGEWFAQDDFRGCAFQNAAAESPETAHPVRQAAHDYSLEIQGYLRRIARDAGLSNPARAAEQLHLLVEGAIATAVATRSPAAARVARAAAKRIVTSA